MELLAGEEIGEAEADVLSETGEEGGEDKEGKTGEESGSEEKGEEEIAI